MSFPIVWEKTGNFFIHDKVLYYNSVQGLTSPFCMQYDIARVKSQ